MIVQEIFFDDHYQYADDGKFWCQFGDSERRHRATLIMFPLGIDDVVLCCAKHQDNAENYLMEDGE